MIKIGYSVDAVFYTVTWITYLIFSVCLEQSLPLEWDDNTVTQADNFLKEGFLVVVNFSCHSVLFVLLFLSSVFLLV